MTQGAFPHLAQPAWLLLLAGRCRCSPGATTAGPASGALTYSRLPAGRGVGGGWRLHLPFYARLLALACLVVRARPAAARLCLGGEPDRGDRHPARARHLGQHGRRGLRAQEPADVAKRVVRDFVAGRPGDRIGLVVFAGGAMTRAPLTTDREMLDTLIDALQLNTLPDGTAIGVALANAAARLKDSPAKSKVIVLVTDGVNNAGEIDPVSAAAVCAGLGIKVYTVGVGSHRSVVPVPLPTDPLTGQP